MVVWWTKVLFLTPRTTLTKIILKNSLRRGPIGHSSLAPATKDKMHPFFIIHGSQVFSSGRLSVGGLVGISPKGHYKSLCMSLCLYRSVQQEMSSCSWKQFYTRLDRYVWQEVLLYDWNFLCKIGQIHAKGYDGNNFTWVWTNLCNRKCSYIAGKHFMRVWTNQFYRECLWVT